MRISLLSLAAAALLGAFAIQSIRPQTALAAFHIAQINEVMVGFNGNPDIQYVEIDQPFGAQPFVGGTQLAAFGPSGNFIGIVLVVPNQVANGDTWIMGTPQFETASGIQADFEFAPGMLDYLERVEVLPGCTGTVQSSVPHGDMYIQINGREVQLDAFASDRLLVTVAD